MSETQSDQERAAAGSEQAWREKLERIGDDEGYYERIGGHHAALLSDRDATLLVTFETVGAIRSLGPDETPLGYAIAAEAGHSSLTLICDRDTWFRDPAVYGYFDRLIDEAFFEDFDRVVFYGAGSCGYAAAAYSVAAPGATVVAVQPQATLQPLRAGWDDRFPEMRRADFTSRFGYAPDMLEGAAEAFLIYDPMERLDAMHAALLARDNATLLPCRNLGGAIEGALRNFGVLGKILTRACEGTFDAAAFWAMYRQRRSDRAYLRDLAQRLDANGRFRLELALCRFVERNIDRPRWFRARANALNATLEPQAGRPALAEEKSPAQDDASLKISA